MGLMFARQPIFDSKNRVYGYELLYRDGSGSAYNCYDGDVATSSVMAAGFLSAGVKELSGKKKFFVNFTENMLLQGVATLFPKDQIVIEVLETVEPSEEVIHVCKSLKKEGYVLALDDFIFRPGYQALVEIADIIKVDFLLTQTEIERKSVIRRFGNGRLRFLAEKVESLEDFNMAVRMGYLLFQGYYFSKPVIESTKAISPVRMNHLNLVKTLQKEEPDFSDITKIIEKDVAFTYEILRIANSVHYYRGNKILSIRQAALRMGLEELKKWALITVMRQMAGESKDAVVTLCVQRAKALEVLSGKVGLKERKMEFYTLGILSMIDVLMGCPMKQVLSELSVSDEIKGLLAGERNNGRMAECYRLVLAFEKGEWDQLFALSNQYSIQADDVAAAGFDAIVWARDFGLE
jgi:EAL and modified HD-GYP domain-containing signal transduction protein